MLSENLPLALMLRYMLRSQAPIVLTDRYYFHFLLRSTGPYVGIFPIITKSMMVLSDIICFFITGKSASCM